MRISGANADMEQLAKAWIGAAVCCIVILGLVLLALQILPVSVR